MINVEHNLRSLRQKPHKNNGNIFHIHTRHHDHELQCHSLNQETKRDISRNAVAYAILKLNLNFRHQQVNIFTIYSLYSTARSELKFEQSEKYASRLQWCTVTD